VTSADIEILLLRPDEIDIDHKVQRTFNAAHAAKIAAVYDPNLFGLGVVSQRADGKYYALDSQHRCAGARLANRGHERVPFKVLRNLTLAQEADWFIKLNALKLRTDAMSSFVLGVTAEYPSNVAIQRIVESFGLKIAGHHSDGTVAAVATLTQLYNQKPNKTRGEPAAALPQGHILSRTLSLLVKAWGHDRNAFDNLLLRGVAGVLTKWGTAVDPDRMAKLLKKSCDAAGATGQIRSHQSISKKSSTSAAIEFFAGVYNRNLAEAKKLK
jgi:hypothetical protein